MRIGKIVKSNTHVDYVCQVYGPAEIEPSPAPADYAFGTFVRMELADSRSYLVGLIYSTILMNPEFGNLGPRLSPPSDLEVFSPDYLREQATLVGIVAVGQVTHGGASGAQPVPRPAGAGQGGLASGPGAQASQGVPPLAATVGATVETLTADEVRAFHRSEGGVVLAYAPLLLAQGDPLIPHLLLNVVNRLSELFPDQARQLAVLRGNLAWKTAVMPAG